MRGPRTCLCSVLWTKCCRASRPLLPCMTSCGMAHSCCVARCVHGVQAYVNAAGTTVTGSLDRSPAVFIYPNTPRLAVRVSGTSNPDWNCDPDALLDSGVWYHVVVVLETQLMEVFLNGMVVCVSNFLGVDTIEPTYDRVLQSNGYGGSSGLVDISDLRWYNTSLNTAQVQAIERELLNVNSTSNMAPGQSFMTSIDCMLTPNRVRAYENGILKLDRQLPADSRDSRSAVSFSVSTTAGNKAGFLLAGISVTEQTTPRSQPSFCPATGNFYQFVSLTGVSYSVAASLARDATNLGISGHLATIASMEENECVSLLTQCDRAWISGQRLNGGWYFSDGPEASTVMNFQYWADGALASAPSTATYLTMDEANCQGAVRMGQWIPCDNGCVGGNVLGYIVEYESSNSYLTEYADGTMGAVVLQSSTLALPAGTTWVNGSATAGRTAMFKNLVNTGMLILLFQICHCVRQGRGFSLESKEGGHRRRC